MRLCSQMPDLQLLLLRLCSQMPHPPHCLHVLFSRLCSQMLDTPNGLRSLKIRRCLRVIGPSHSQHCWLFCGCAGRSLHCFSPIALLPPTHSPCCCFYALLPSSSEGCFLFFRVQGLATSVQAIPPELFVPSLRGGSLIKLWARRLSTLACTA